MMDHPYTSAIGARIGFPIVDVDNHAGPSTCLATSYNGVGQTRDADADSRATYRALCSSDVWNQVRIRDAVRCASAAPWYFTPRQIPEHGQFMDGGMNHNNPSRLALSELQRMLPACKRPDQFVSVGTGSSRQSTPNSTGGRLRRIIGSGSVYEAFQHYMKHHFDGDEQFHDMCEMLRAAWPNDQDDVGRRFRRFNLPLGGKLPDLADAGAMGELSKTAWDHFASNPAILDQARAIIASSFYFELRCMPMFKDECFLCHGRVLCRVSPVHPTYRSFMQKLDPLEATFHVW